VLLAASAALGGGSVVPVGTYLYANPENPERWSGRLTVRFTTPGPQRLVVAYGRRYRKVRRSRRGTTETEREHFKPWQGRLIDDGRGAVFFHLPADAYGIMVVDPQRMLLHEGMELLVGRPDPALATDEYFEEIRQSLGLRTDRIGGWDAFFDNKQFERFQTDGTRACVFLQQMRLGRALAESGAVLQGCIHSIDMVWLERARVEGAGWQILGNGRQQLYRDEIPARTFFQHHLVPELQRIVVSRQPVEVGPVALPGTGLDGQ
jgi:hypothetical protein